MLAAGAYSPFPGGSSKFCKRIARNRFSMIRFPTMKIKVKMITDLTPAARVWSYITLFQSSPIKTMKIVVKPKRKLLKDKRG